MADYTGNTLSAFADSYLRARALAMQENAQESLEQERLSIAKDRQEAAQLRALQAEKARMDLADRAALPEDINKLVSAPTQPLELVPAQPAVPAVPATLTAQPQEGEDPEAAAMIPRTPGTPEVPAVPAQVEQIRTPQSAMAAVGPNGMTRILGSPEGKIAYAQSNIVTPEDAARRQQHAKIFEEVKQGQKEADDLALSGDIIGSYLKRAAVMERLASVGKDDDAKMRAMERMQQYRNEAAALGKAKRDEKDEFALAQADLKRMGEADIAHRKNPTVDTKAEQIQSRAEAKSKTGQRNAFDFFAKESQTDDKNMDEATQPLWKLIVAEMAKQSASKPMNASAAWRAVAAKPENADVVARAMPHIWADKRLPQELKNSFLGVSPNAKIPSNKFQAAALAAAGDGFELGTPAYHARFLKALQEYEDLTPKQVVATLSRTRAQLVGLLKDAQSRKAKATDETGPERLAASRDIGTYTKAIRDLDTELKTFKVPLSTPLTDPAARKARVSEIAAEEMVRLKIDKTKPIPKPKLKPLQDAIRVRVVEEGLDGDDDAD